MNRYIVYDILEFHPPDEHFLLKMYTSDPLWAKCHTQIETQNQERILRDYGHFCKQHMIFPMNLPKNPDIQGLLTDPIKYIGLKKLLQTTGGSVLNTKLPTRSRSLPCYNLHPSSRRSLLPLPSLPPPPTQLPPSSQNYLKLLIFRTCLAKGALRLADLFNQPPKDHLSLNRDILILLKYNQIIPSQVLRVIEYALERGFNATNQIPPECDHQEEINQYIFQHLL